MSQFLFQKVTFSARLKNTSITHHNVMTFNIIKDIIETYHDIEF